MCAKKIAVLTSGGDAPGMNAAVRAVVRTAISFGMEVYGVRHGYNGLLTGEVQKMELRSVSNIIQHGGTALFTARSPEFNTPEGVQKAAAKCRELGIDGVVVVGGDGSFRGARDLTGAGVPCIGVPGTIDNDISSSEYTIGYDTAMNTAMEMIDRIRDTTESHDRCSVVEVMGRRCGDIALNTGIAVGAIATLVPEVKYDFEKDMMGGKLSCKINARAVPVLPGAEKAADDFLYTAAGQRNRNHTGPFVRFEGVPFAMEEVLFDPQTSGGLLLAVDPAEASTLEKELQSADLPAKIVGEIVPRTETEITVTY